MNEISISELPLALDTSAAIEAAYRTDLDRIQDKLELGVSVLVECDKQLTIQLYAALRGRLKQENSPTRLRLISGHIPNEGSAPPQSLTQRLLNQLTEAVFSGAESEVLVLPHLDILTTTTRSGLNMETREAAALLYENPSAVFLGFKDPSFELPKVIENVFTIRLQMIGIGRDRLPHLITQHEARKFGVETFNPYSLYKYVSGLNAVRIRQVLSHFANRLDFSEAHPESRDAIIREIREMTLVSDVDLPKVDLDKDIGGYDKVKERIKADILELIAAKDKSSNPDEIRNIEEIIPKGIIFYGPPGTGKTFFAKAIATALDATLTIVSGPELKSKWVGESEENLRRVFAQARKSAPSLIVFDELDSFAAARGTYAGSGVEHSMVNQMLTEMDGFRKEEMVFVIGTTNFMESLDSALLRPGRFELGIHIPAPRDKDRRAILDIYKEKFGIEISEEMLEYAVRQTAGFADERAMMRYSGDHLYAMMRALKREQLRRGGELVIEQKDIDKALSRAEKQSVELQEEEKKTIAIHESGHAVLAYILPNCPTIEKVTIETGEDQTLGYVRQEMRKNKYVTTEEELLDDICVSLGGREAERLLIGKISGGAYSDLQRANEVARMMVEELGMGGDFGAQTFNAAGDPSTGSMGSASRRVIADDTAQKIDQSIGALLGAQQQRAKAKLEEHKEQLESMRDKLLEKKTLALADIKELFGDKDYKESTN